MQDVTQTSLDILREVLNASANKAVFTIDGKIGSLNTNQSFLLVIIRWNPGNASNNDGRVVFFSVGEDMALQHSFHQLVKECESATFGERNKDVFNEEYRKTGKMDTENLCINFTPCEYGVVDMIVQALAYNNDKSRANYRGIRAQLYKLNVHALSVLCNEGRQEDH